MGWYGIRRDLYRIVIIEINAIDWMEKGSDEMKSNDELKRNK